MADASVRGSARGPRRLQDGSRDEAPSTTRAPASGNSGSERPPLNVGVVGLGYWGPNLLRVLAEMDGVNVTRICDQDSERLRRFAGRYPGAAPDTRFETLIADPSSTRWS